MPCPEDCEHEDVLCRPTPGRRVLERSPPGMPPRQQASRHPSGSFLPTLPRAVGPQGACPDEGSSRLFPAWRGKQHLPPSARPPQATGRDLRPSLKHSFANYGIALCLLEINRVCWLRPAGLEFSVPAIAVTLAILSLVFNNGPSVKRLKRPSSVGIMLGI